MHIENDRRKRIERRVLLAGLPAGTVERRTALQRRVLDIGVLSFESWLSRHSVASGTHFQIKLTPSVSGDEGLERGLF